MSADWIKRAYVPAEDEDALVYMWLKSYAHSAYGKSVGADDDSGDPKRTTDPLHRRERVYWESERPVVQALLASADVEVLCDPDRPRAGPLGPAVIWAFAVTSRHGGRDLVHWVEVKREFIREGFGGPMVKDLLGARLEHACGFTHDLVGLKRSGYVHRVDERGKSYAVPIQWYSDPTALVRMLLGARRAA